MESIRRYSPVSFEKKAIQTESRGGWEIVLKYEDEDNGPYLVDMSHIAKWDIQDARITRLQSVGITIPETPGTCMYDNGILISRLNQTQAFACHLVGNDSVLPNDPAYTDITEAYALLALIGKDVFLIMEKI